ncbi:MAG: low temperature requirement protein A, partial [Geodermatophilaceae bacterium]
MSVSTSSGVERHASWLELFFDLVFVVVVAALAGQLHEDHSVLGLAVFAGLFVPVWWCWRSFTWYATGYSDDPRCRIGLLAGMLGVAVLSIGVAGAAGEGESRTFVLAYVGLLIILGGLYGRIWLLFPAARSLARRYVLGYAVGAVIWSASLALQEGARPWLWAVAMVVLIATPVAVLRQPRRAYHAAHIAERYGLFTIIVLGESVVVTVSGLD